MKKYAVIPARYGSSRLPGKPLLEISGKPLIQYAYENAVSAGFDDVIIATDDKRIVDAARAFQATALITDPSHQSGTDRVAEVIEHLNLRDEDIVCNLQGDEPGVSPSTIKKLLDTLVNSSIADMSTLVCKISDPEELFNPNVVKAVFDKNGRALYFSRAPIPWERDTFKDLSSITTSKILPALSNNLYHKHIGLYGFTVKALKAVSRMQVSLYETTEKLEQLRALENDIVIEVGVIDEAPLRGVDTYEDYLFVKSVIESET